MDHFLGIAGINAASAFLLALAVAATARIVRRPALVHVLWIVVLLELFAPPVLEVSILPDFGLAPVQEETGRSGSVTPALPIGSAGSPKIATGSLGPSPSATPFDVPAGTKILTLPRLALATWAAGTVLLLLLAAVRMRRFRHLLRGTTEAPAALQTMVRELSGRLGLSRCPRIRLVPADISPMLWFRFGSPQILFPVRLLDRLSLAELRTLVAHELGHVRRRDHWVRYFELIAGALFWWHPVVWWARTGLRRAEEQCCDGLVLRALPDHSRDYAKGLLKTVEFLSGSGHRLPALASGAGEVKNLEARLTMIMKRRVPKSLSPWQWMTLALVAVSLLLVFPTRAAQERDEALAEEQVAGNEASAREDVLELEKQAIALEQQLREVRARQMELEMGLQDRQEEFELQRLRHEAARTEAEELALKGEHRRSEELRARALALEAELLQRESISRRIERDLEEAMVHRELDRMRQQLARLHADGHAVEAEQLARELAAYQDEVVRSGLHRRHDDEARAMQEIAEHLAQRARQLEAAGRPDEAAEIERRIRELVEEIRDRERAEDSRVH